MNIQGILDTLLDDRTKGIPGGTEPFALKDIAGKGWRVLKEDLPLPLLVLKQSALDHNRQVFKAFLEEHHVSFAPHGKTPMAPQIFKKQFEDGAWANHGGHSEPDSSLPKIWGAPHIDGQPVGGPAKHPLYG